MTKPLDIFFPKSCTICKKKGFYLCKHCKKLFKRSLPECYLCRKISPNYKTHCECKQENINSALDYLFVAWEYNDLSSILLKKYKYNYVRDISTYLSDFFIESIKSSTFGEILNETLLISVPLTKKRYKERGFNQVTEISYKIGKAFNIPFEESLIRRTNGSGHQALRDKDERRKIRKDSFVLNKNLSTTKYQRITIVDDVITTGATLEAISSLIRENSDYSIEVNGLCLFRGKPYYLETD